MGPWGGVCGELWGFWGGKGGYRTSHPPPPPPEPGAVLLQVGSAPPRFGGHWGGEGGGGDLSCLSNLPPPHLPAP